MYCGMEPNYANLVIKIIKWYMNCGITAVASYGHNIEHNGSIFEYYFKS